MIMKYLSHIDYYFVLMDADIFCHIVYIGLCHINLFYFFCGQTHAFKCLLIMES